ncbi:hypothetical protein [Methylorubrum extorquens]|jgi:hypothetical protein
MADTVEALSRADDATLDLIKRDADAFLAAQLTVALAGNQRAMTFFGFLATASGVIGGASIAALATDAPSAPFAWSGLVTVAGFLLSMFMANSAAMPDSFSYVGNDPEGWAEDVMEKKPLSVSKAEALADSSRCIGRNQAVLHHSARMTKLAVWTAWGSLVAGAVAVAVTAGLLLP